MKKVPANVRFPEEHRVYMRGLRVLALLVIGGLILAIWIATLHP